MIPSARLTVLRSGLAILLIACGGPASQAPPAATQPSPLQTTAISTLTKSDVRALAAAFNDQPFQGGQVTPLLAKWVGDDTFVFLQFDKPQPQDATVLLYMGVGRKGVFCAEAQPDKSGGSFRAFHQWTAPDFEKGVGGNAGAQGYWMSYLAADQFTLAGRSVKLGVDYGIPSGPAAPSCGSSAAPSFNPPGAGKIAGDAIQKMSSIFSDQPLTGGQIAPRSFKQVNDQVLAFVQFDKPTPKDASALLYIGIWKKSTYCKSTQPNADFTHFHRTAAPTYGQGHAGPPGIEGFWGIWVAATPFESQGRQITPGVDRQFSPTPPPSSC